MSNRIARIASCVVASVGLALAAGCATRPDIVGHNDDAEAWAETQSHEPKDKTKSWPGSRPAPSASQPAPAQPAPAPQGATK